MSLPRTLQETLTALTPAYEDLYRDLHRNPELSFAEHRTAQIVAAHLAALGYEVKSGIGGTGVVGILRNNPGPCVLARADMDALPVTETAGVPYASTTTATDAEGRTVGVMHACGHDMHVTALLAVCEVLSQHQDAWNGTFVALFQPAEEVGTGAAAMVSDGLSDAIPQPDVCLGQHVMGLPAGTVASRPGPALSAADSIRVTVYGKGSHGSMPHLGVDPILLASTIVLRLNTIVSRELKPGQFGVVTVGSIQAGTKSNIIPSSAQLLLNLRAYDEETRQQLRAAVERIVKAECLASSSPRDPEIEYYDPFPLTDNSADVFERVRASFDEHFGARSITQEPSTGSEDFSNIPRAFCAPYLFWYFGGFDPALFDAQGNPGPDVPGNHNATFVPQLQPTLRTGMEAMTLAVLSYLARA